MKITNSGQDFVQATVWVLISIRGICQVNTSKFEEYLPINHWLLVLKINTFSGVILKQHIYQSMGQCNHHIRKIKMIAKSVLTSQNSLQNKTTKKMLFPIVNYHNLPKHNILKYKFVIRYSSKVE